MNNKRINPNGDINTIRMTPTNRNHNYARSPEIELSVRITEYNQIARHTITTLTRAKLGRLEDEMVELLRIHPNILPPGETLYNRIRSYKVN